MAGPWASEYSEKYVGAVETMLLGRAVERAAQGGGDEGGAVLSPWSLAEPGRPVSASFAPSTAPGGDRSLSLSHTLSCPSHYVSVSVLSCLSLSLSL